MNGTRRGMSGWTFPLVYLAFGVVHAAYYAAYCMYRADAGHPSDLPCVSWLWTPMDIVGWPLMALGDAASGQSMLQPEFWVRGVGIAFLAGFPATIAVMYFRSRRSS